MTTPFPLGRLLFHDEASRNFMAAMAEDIHTVKHRRFGPILDQGNLGSCTGNALAGAINTAPLHKPRRILHEPEAVDLYSLATTLDGLRGTYPPSDTGSTGLGVAKAGVRKGYLKEYRHAFGYDQLRAALMLQPVIVGTVWKYDMFFPDANGFVSDTGEEKGGHEYEVLGYNAKDDYFLCANSWTNLWGVKGYFKVAGPVMRRLLAADGDVVVPIPA